MWKESKSKMYALHGNSSNFIAIRTYNTQYLWLESFTFLRFCFKFKTWFKQSFRIGSSCFPTWQSTHAFQVWLTNMDQLLRFIANPNLSFSAKILVAWGDFRQFLPVQPQSNRCETLDLSVKKSLLWKYFKHICLEKICGFIFNRKHLQNKSLNSEMEIFLKIL